MSKFKRIQPVLLGSDFNVYGMARSFHEAYNVTSIALAGAQLTPTKFSSIVDVHVQPNFHHPDVFIQTLRQFINDHQTNQDTTHMLIACGDHYVELVTSFLEELSNFFICPYVSNKLQKKLEDKKSFYQLCETYNMPYPKTVFVTNQDKKHIEQIVDNLPFDYPMILKPNNSITYKQTEFSGKKKAYFIDTSQEMKHLLNTIYNSGYSDDMIIQDMIPGDDTHMRVMNVYVDQHHRVRMMCLGRVILEDPSPASVGNYLGLLPDENDAICHQIKQFLEQINYTGFANFDMKYDTRDGKYKLFEINLRQGRSSYFVTLSGFNLAKYLVDDYIDNVPFDSVTYAKGDSLWLGAPKSLITHYINDKQLINEINTLYNQGKYGYTALYDNDRSLRRWILQHYTLFHYYINFKKYYKRKD